MRQNLPNFEKAVTKKNSVVTVNSLANTGKSFDNWLVFFVNFD